MSLLVDHLQAVRRIHATGGETDEESGYLALAALLDCIGKGLKPSVWAVFELKNPRRGVPQLRAL